MNLMETLIGDNLPPAILQKMTKTDSNELDPDKAMPILLGIYYKGGAFQGAAVEMLVETCLQQALRPDDQIDLNDPVTFRQINAVMPLKVMAVDLNQARLVDFPQGLLHYGYDGEEGRMHYDDFSVARAVRASMSIPLVFAPVRIPDLNSHKADGTFAKYATLVDGGLINNFPAAQFADQTESTRICGFWLGSDPDLVPAISTDRIMGYIMGLLSTMMEAHDKYAMARASKQMLLVPIGLQIQTTKQEKTHLDEQLKIHKVQLNDTMTSLTAGLAQLAQSKVVVDDDPELGEFVEQKMAYFTQAIEELGSELTELEHTDTRKREAQTLDFSLTPEQKDDLVRNGEKAAEAAIANL
jgi:predicted acylesterase/phospholipase RssA